MADYSIRCQGNTYLLLTLYAVACVLLYPIGINVLYTWCVVRITVGRFR